MLTRQVRLRFDHNTAQRFTALIEHLDQADQLAQVGDWVIQRATGAELISRVEQLLKQP